MINEKIEKAQGIVAGLWAEALGSADSFAFIKGVLNNIQDEYIMISRKDCEDLLKLLEKIKNYYEKGDEPRLVLRDAPYLSLYETLEEAILAH